MERPSGAELRIRRQANKTPRGVYTKSTKRKTSSGCSPSSGYVADIKEKLCSARFAGVSPAEANFSFSGLTSATREGCRLRRRGTAGLVFCGGQDVREPAVRAAFPHSGDFWRLPHSLTVFAVKLAPRDGLHPGGVVSYAIRYFTLRTKRNYVRYANSITAFQRLVNSNGIVIPAFRFACRRTA